MVGGDRVSWRVESPAAKSRPTVQRPGMIGYLDMFWANWLVQGTIGCTPNSVPVVVLIGLI